MRIVWRRLPGGERDVQAAALGVIETLTMHIQRRLDAPTLLRPRAASHPGASPRPQLQQAAEPLSYAVDRTEIVRWTWANPVDASLKLHLSDGRELTLKAKPCVRSRELRNVAAMEPQRTTRRPARTMSRPGTGGVTRRSRNPFERLDDYGTCSYLNCVEGARVCVVQIPADGDAVTAIVSRNSAEEKEQRLRLQVEPCWGMASAFDLKVRTIIAATHMSGMRPVRDRDALPPPPNWPERDDMVILLDLVERGLIENVVVRDIDRLARDELQGFKIIERFAEAGVNLYVEGHGRLIDYVTDRKLLRQEFSSARDEHDGIVRRTQRGQIEKGVMAGKGWLGPTPFGIVRDPETKDLHQDDEQWWIIEKLHELGDIGAPSECGSGFTGAMSAREAERYMHDAYGVDIDHDRIRTIWLSEIYSTGARSTTMRGTRIAQDPAILKRPIPLDRKERVIGNLRFRRGGERSTKIGEFILNTVETVHVQCAGSTSATGVPILVKGYNHTGRSGRVLGKYRHSPCSAERCKHGGRGYQGSFVWEKDWLEPPIITAVREIAEHPELLRQAALAARHDFAPTSQRLERSQREALEFEYAAALRELDESAEIWVERRLASRRSTPADADTKAHVEKEMSAYLRVHERLQARVDQLRRRLETDDAYVDVDPATPGIDGAGGAHSPSERLNAFLEILTVETPEDDRMMKLRARLFQRIVSRVEIDDSGDGPITITLYGHLVPDHGRHHAINPLTAAHDLLDAHLAEKEGRIPLIDTKLQRLAEARSQIETDLSERTLKSVWSCTQGLLRLPSGAAQARLASASLTSTIWQRNRGGVTLAQRAGRVPAWCLLVRADATVSEY